MNRQMIFDYVKRKYQSVPEYPWIKYSDYAVLRHNDNNKWYAVVMNIPESKLGINSEKKTDIINLKCDTIMSGSLRMTKGIFPAYHMNKEKWISILLDGSVNENMIYDLLDISFEMTKNKRAKSASQ